jgi:GT2 family glycosyltransferase
MENGMPDVARPISVAILVVSYRTGPLVAKLLASIELERQRDPSLSLRVIVVDNASGDAPELEELVAQKNWRQWATIITSPTNGGFSYGNNVAFRHVYASGDIPEFFYLLNPDAELRPGAIRELVQFLQDHPAVGLAGGGMETERGEPWPYAFRFPTFLGEIERELAIGLVTRLLKDHMVLRKMGTEPEPVDWVAGASLLVRRQIIDELGGMDEGYFLYYEETDFCRKAKQAGWSTWYVPASRIMHMAGQSTGLTLEPDCNPRLPDWWFRSRVRYFVKNHGVAYAAATDAACLLAHLVCVGKRALQGRSAANVPHYLSDFVRNSVLLPRNRRAAPVREFRPGDERAQMAHAAADGPAREVADLL